MIEKFPAKPHEEVELDSSAYGSLKKSYSSIVSSKLQNTSAEEFISSYPKDLDKIIEVQNIIDSRADIYEQYLELKE